MSGPLSSRRLPRVARAAPVLCLLLAAADLRAEGRLVASPRALDFGERGHGESPATLLKLENVGDAPVQITSIEASCGCTKVSPSRVTKAIPPGGQVELRVTMSSGRIYGRLDKYVTVETAKAGAIKIPTRMSVFRGYSVEPRSLRIAGEAGGEKVEASATLTSGAGGRPVLEVEEVVLLGAPRPRPTDRIEARVESRSDGTRLVVTVHPELAAGRFAAEVRGKLDGRSFEFPVSGEMFEGIKLDPPWFNYSRAEIAPGEPATATSKIAAIDDVPFRITTWRVRWTRPADPVFRVELGDEPARGGVEHELTLRILSDVPVPPGLFSGRLEIETDHPEKPLLEMRISGFVPKPR